MFFLIEAGFMEHTSAALGWLLGVVVALISLIYADLRKQIGSQLADLKSQMSSNTHSLQENTKSSHALSSEIAVMSEKLQGIKREQNVAFESIHTKIKELELKQSTHDSTFTRHSDRLHELGTLIHQVVGLLRMRDLETESKKKTIF